MSDQTIEKPAFRATDWPTDGRITLARFKSYPRQSRETTAFNADLLLDGQKVAEVSNDGGGGSNRVEFWFRAGGKTVKVDSGPTRDYIRSVRIDDHHQEEGDRELFGEFFDEDFFISTLVGYYEEFDSLRRKKNFLFRAPGLTYEVGAWSVIGGEKSDPRIIPHLDAKYPGWVGVPTKPPTM